MSYNFVCSVPVVMSITTVAWGSYYYYYYCITSSCHFSYIFPAGQSPDFLPLPFCYCNCFVSRRIQNALGMIHTSFVRCVCYTEPAQTNITQLTDSSSWACWLKENVWRRAECAVKGMSEVLSCFCRASAPEVYKNIVWLLKTQSRIFGYFVRERRLKIISAVTSWTNPAVRDTARWSVQQKSCL